MIKFKIERDDLKRIDLLMQRENTICNSYSTEVHHKGTLILQHMYFGKVYGVFDMNLIIIIEKRQLHTH